MDEATTSVLATEMTPMPLIEREFIPPKKEQLNIRLAPDVLETLNRYCVFLNSSQNYVVEQALGYMFGKDREFQTWLATQDVSPGAGAGSSSHRGE